MEHEEHRSWWASGGAVVAAALASACCILPLVFGGLGVSALGLAAAFEPLRPYLVAAAAVLLAVGFYYAYFRRARTGEAACDARSSRSRLGRPVLWLAAVAVAALGLFPSYVGSLTGERPAARVASELTASLTMSLHVEGMTCEACAIGLERELVSVAGVMHADVSYAEKSASVVVDRSSPPSEQELLVAVERTGYRGEVVAQPE